MTVVIAMNDYHNTVVQLCKMYVNLLHDSFVLKSLYVGSIYNLWAK